MRQLTVKANNVALHAEAFGRQTDPAILLVMGATASGSWWPQEFCKMLAAEGHYVIRYDHRDTGASTKCEPGKPDYSLDDLADDMMHVLDAHDVARAHLAGMSLGGLLSQLVAVKYPERTLTLTLIASEPLATVEETFPPIDQNLIDHFMTAATLDWSNREAVVQFNIEAWRLTAGSAHEFDREHIRRLAEEDFDRNDNPPSAMNHAQLGGGEQWFNRLGDVDAPTLIIHGTDDPVLNFGNAKALAGLLSSSDLLALEGVGHELHPKDWGKIVAAVTKHIQSAI